MDLDKVTIKLTEEADLYDLMHLWNNGEVMKYIGFPEGLGYGYSNMKSWFRNINKNDYLRHYSIYLKNYGLCGETYYNVSKENKIANINIKLLSKLRGKGIAQNVINFIINEVFKYDLANRIYVNLEPENKRALNFFRKIGFKESERPSFVEQHGSYLELDENQWNMEEKKNPL